MLAFSLFIVPSVDHLHLWRILLFWFIDDFFPILWFSMAYTFGHLVFLHLLSVMGVWSVLSAYHERSGPMQSVEYSSEVLGLRLLLEKEIQKREQLEQELRGLKSSSSRKNVNGNVQKQSDELLTVRQRLDDELKERERLETEIRSLREQVGLLSDEGDEVQVVFA